MREQDWGLDLQVGVWDLTSDEGWLDIKDETWV